MTLKPSFARQKKLPKHSFNTWRQREKYHAIYHENEWTCHENEESGTNSISTDEHLWK